MKRFISFSGGVESTTMCILYGKGATAIFADAGDEEPEMYERLKVCKEVLTDIHQGDFQFLMLKPFIIAKGHVCSTLDELAIAYKYFPSPVTRYCTRELKIEVIDSFLSRQGRCELLLGFNADEEPGQDRTGNMMKCENVLYQYPLYNDDLTREDCYTVLDQYGLRPNFPPYMGRGGCRKCPFKSKKEAKAKFYFNPIGFQEDKQFEMNLQDQRKKFYGINMNFPEGYKSVENECLREIQMFGFEEMKAQYKSVEVPQPCGAFCHR